MTEAIAGFVIDTALAVHNALVEAGIECQIGGAIALDYHIDDPRATRDVDVNVSLPAAEAERAFATLPEGLPRAAEDLARAERDGQVRLMWPVENAAALPVDLFFAVHEFHEVVRERAVEVPLRTQTVRVLSATDLTIFKSLFDRPKDWIDIQAMLDAHDCSVDLADAARWVGSIVGDDDPRAVRLRSLA